MSTLANLEPLDAPAIRAGHRALLETLRELLDEIGRGGRDLDVEALRGAVAFLRQGVVPFARREERALSTGDEVWEGVAFEHAFIEAEIDRLAREAAEVIQGNGGSEMAGARVQRTLCRIEAVLELHALRADDRGGLGVAAAVAGAAEQATREAGTAKARGRSKEVMEAGEVDRFLRTHHWGMLCTVGDGRPYAVPVSYGHDDEGVVVATGPGRKAAYLEANPAVCLTIAEVEAGGRWESVVISGRARWLESPIERIPALWMLAGAARRLASLDGKKLQRLRAARVFRIDAVEVTGRRKGG